MVFFVEMDSGALNQLHAVTKHWAVLLADAHVVRFGLHRSIGRPTKRLVG